MQGDREGDRWREGREVERVKAGSQGRSEAGRGNEWDRERWKEGEGMRE